MIVPMQEKDVGCRVQSMPVGLGHLARMFVGILCSSPQQRVSLRSASDLCKNAY